MMSGLRSCGIKVPEDIVVVGLDNIDFGHYSRPSLTTAGVDNAQLATMLFETLRDRIEDPCHSTVVTKECPSKIYLRGSCGCQPECEQ
jgi:LacI family transcriptional regulator